MDYSRATVQEINQDWDRYQSLRDRDRFLGRLSPARFRGKILEASLVSSADEVIDAYNRNSDPSLQSVDWKKAQLCLRHAAELDPSDRAVAGRLALCDGYVNLLQSGKLPNAGRSEESFRTAAADLPKSPDPHLALARLYVYSFTNMGKALAEFHQAERLGFHFGPREIEEQGDGYLLRGESELRGAKRAEGAENDDRDKLTRLSRSDFQRARNLYEPISGFSNVSANLNRLEQDEHRLDDLEQEDAATDEEPTISKAKSKPYRHHVPQSAFQKFFSHLKWQ